MIFKKVLEGFLEDHETIPKYSPTLPRVEFYKQVTYSFNKFLIIS